MTQSRPAPRNGGHTMRSAIIEGWVEVLCHRGQWSEHHHHVEESDREATGHRWKTSSCPLRGADSRHEAHCKVNGKSFATEGTVCRGAGGSRHMGASFAPRGLKEWGKRRCWKLVRARALEVGLSRCRGAPAAHIMLLETCRCPTWPSSALQSGIVSPVARPPWSKGRQSLESAQSRMRGRNGPGGVHTANP